MAEKVEREHKVGCGIAGQEVMIVMTGQERNYWNCEVLCPYFKKSLFGYPRCQKGGKCIIYEGLEK
jgi:hypothetical protein